MGEGGHGEGLGGEVEGSCGRDGECSNVASGGDECVACFCEREGVINVGGSFHFLCLESLKLSLWIFVILDD